MTILIASPLYPPDVGGPATYAKLLEKELPPKGIAVTVLNFGEVLGFPKGIRHLMYLARLLLQGVRADVIFALDPVSVGYPASFAAHLLGKRFIVKIVGDYAWEQGRQRYGVEDHLDVFLEKRYDGPIERLRAVQTRVARRADTIIVPSEYFKSVIVRWGIAEEKIAVVYNAVELPDNLPSRAEARAMFEVGKSDFVVLSAGRNVPWKGFNILRKAVGELQEDHPNIRLEIFHTLPRRELLAWMRAADVFVLNSGYEAFSHILLEAMALKTPVVASRAGGNSEIVTDPSAGSGQANGLLFEHNNSAELKAALLRLYKDREFRETLSLVGQKTAGQFSKARMIDETIKIFTA